MSNKVKLGGGKVTASHTTVTEAGEEVVRHARRLELVTKISLGQIWHVSGGRRDLKFLPIIAGLKAKVRGNGAVQELYIYTKEPKKVERLLMESFRT